MLGADVNWRSTKTLYEATFSAPTLVGNKAMSDRVLPPPFMSDMQEEMATLGTLLEGIEETLEKIVTGEQVIADAEFPRPPASEDTWSESEIANDRDQYEELLRERFGTPLYFSFVLLNASTLESWVMRLCRYIGWQKQIPLRINQLVGSDLEKARTYLMQLANWPFPSEETWAWVRDFFEVRNSIAHWGGRFSEVPHDELKKRLRDLEGISRRRRGIRVENETKLTLADLLGVTSDSESTNSQMTSDESERRLLKVTLVVDRGFCIESIRVSRRVLATICEPWLPSVEPGAMGPSGFPPGTGA